MANTKISALTALTGADAAQNDVLAIVDTSTATTKKITREELFKSVDYLALDLANGLASPTEGQLTWDTTYDTLAVGLNGGNVVMHVGQDTYYRVRNNTGSTIAAGTVCRFAGSLGNSGILLVAPFIANNTVDSHTIMGISSESIANGADGLVTNFGEVRGINTSAYTDGAILYASSTVSGGLTATKPALPNNIISVAAVVNAANNGTLFVRPIIESSLANTVSMSGGGTVQEYAGFATRSAFVTWASGKTPATGTVVFAAGDGYRYIGSGTAISDLAGWVPLEVSRLTHWPATLAGFQAAMTYCEGKKLIIPAGSYSYTLTSDLTFNNIDNIVIEGEGQGISNITFTHALSFMRILRGINITVRNLSLTVNCTFIGTSNTAFVDFRSNSFLMDNCSYSTNADISSTRYHFIGITPDTAVSCDDFTISNCKVDKIGYLLLKGTSSVSTHKRIRYQNNVITNGQKEPLSLNAPLGSVDDAIITDNFCDGHLAGLDATDGHWLGVAGAKRFVITGNVLIGNTREGIHVEDGSEGGIIANNTLYMDFTGLTSTAMIAVLPGLAGAGDMSSNIVISNNVMKQTGATKMGWGVTVYDFTSGTQASSSKHIKVTGNIVQNCEYGYDVFGGAVTGNEVTGNTAVACTIGFLHRYENQDTYRGNTSKDCDYGVATYSMGRFTDHVFNQCTALVGSKNVAAGVVALEGFTVIKADRNFTIGSSFGYAIGAGFDSSARTSMDVAVMMNGITQATYIHKTMRADWDGTTLTSTAGISRAANATATLSVSSGVLTATVGVTAAENNCRFSAKFNGTALLSAAVV
jgi:parallel beta-helix repeat protein